MNTPPQAYILGSQGGQLVVPELMEDQYFVLRYAFPDLEAYDVRKREKKIFLDKTTFLPVKVISRQETLGKKQVLTRVISEVQINRPEDQALFQKISCVLTRSWWKTSRKIPSRIC